MSDIMNMKNFIPVAVVIALVSCVGASFFVMDASAEDPVTVNYGYSPTFISTATEAEDVKWDFGDGVILDSRQAGLTAYEQLLAEHGGNVWAPRHTYPDNGALSYIDYTVVQTVYNSYEGGSEDSFSSVIRIMGPPAITFVSNGGSSIGILEVPKIDRIGQPATQPADPVFDGYTFEGWFTDEELIEAFDWSTPIEADMTLYAAWDEVPIVIEPEPEPEPEDDGVQMVTCIAALILIIAGALLIRHVYKNEAHKLLYVLGAILIIIGAALFYGGYSGMSISDIVDEIKGILPEVSL